MSVILRATADLLRVITTAGGASLKCHVSFIEADSSTPPVPQTISRVNTAPITTATTTTILDCTTAGRARRVMFGGVVNDSATVSDTAQLIHTDGTTITPLGPRVTLLPNESLTYEDGGRYVHRDSQGGEYAYNGPIVANLGPTNTIAETMPRETCPEVNTTAGATGTLFLQAVYLKAGQLVSNISIWSATAAAGTPTNGFFALYDASRNLLAQSANFTTEAWAANSVKTKAMTTAYRVTVSGLYYVGLLQVATTIATIKGGTAKTGGQLAGAAPILHGTSSTGLTTTLPNPAAAITVGTASIYAAVS